MDTIRIKKEEAESVTPILKQLNAELSRADALLDENEKAINSAPARYAKAAAKINAEFSLGIDSINAAASSNTNSEISLMRQFDLAKKEIDHETSLFEEELAKMLSFAEEDEEKKEEAL